MWADRLPLDAFACLEAADIAMLVTEPTLDAPGPRIVYVNAAFTRMTGWPREEIVGRTPRVLQGPDTDHQIFADLRAKLTRGEPWAGETVNYRRDGTPFIMEWSITPVTAPDGTVTQLLAVQRDVTERNRRNRALRESERRFRGVFDGSGQAIVLLAPDGTVQTANPSALAWAGVDTEALAGRPFAGTPWWRACPESRLRVRQAIEVACDGAASRFTAVLGARPDDTRTVDLTIGPVFDHDGAVAMLVVEGRDVSELVDQTRRLERETALLLNATRIGGMASWDYDAGHDHLEVGGAALSLFGLAPDQRRMSIESFLTLVHPDDAERVRTRVRDALTEGRRYECDYRLTVAGQPERVVHAVGEIVHDPSGAVAGMVGIVQDVTERHATEQALRAARLAAEEASAAKSRFLATMSHELRTPLNAVNGFSSLIEQEAFGPLGAATYRDYARSIRESGEHLLGIIDQILDVTRLDTDRIGLDESWSAAADLLQGAWDILQGVALSKPIDLVVVPAPDLRVYGDAGLLQQVLLNLGSNAIKFSPAGTRVTLSLELPVEGGCAFRVDDCGPGIPEAAKAKVTQPFYQADQRLARAHEGVGLGLYLANAFLELHDGRLALDSGPDGTTACAILPAARVAGAH